MIKILFVLLAILFFGIMIAIHEFGHFFTAKLLGVKVNEFAIGMGPALWRKEAGETVYALRAFPIGGYCAMEGEDVDTGDPRAFTVQPAWKKLIILCAGSGMNFLLGLAIVTGIYMGMGTVYAPVIDSFMDGFLWEGEDGLMVGDRLLEIDGKTVYFQQDAIICLDKNDGISGIDLVLERNGETIILEDFPMTRLDYQTEEGETDHLFGLVISGREVALSGLETLQYAFLDTVNFVRTVWVSLMELIGGNVGLSDLSGVIGIVDTIGEVGTTSENVSDGLINVLYLTAFISVNLAVMNLLPLPALDGGRVFFVLVNGLVYLLSRRRVPEKYEGYVHTAGMVLLLGLMVVVALSDIWKLLQ